ncbi:MAG: NAD(P)/FAD-dependent oxidoreductase, partial [Actinomycetota bacterium]
MSTRVLVVGAGPAGVACAMGLQRAGASVSVVDKASFPRDKCCGDGLTTSALRHLETLGLDARAVPNARECSVVRVHTPRGRTVELDLPAGSGTYAVIAPRLDLDDALVA